MSVVQKVVELWVAIYVRVSTVGQEDGTSLDTQEDACRKVAASLGFPESRQRIFRETGTGAELDRPVLQKVLGEVRKGNIGAVVVYTADRLARDPVHLLMVTREIEAAGAPLHFVEGPSGNTPESELIRFILGYTGHRERLMIAERSMRGKGEVAKPKPR